MPALSPGIKTHISETELGAKVTPKGTPAPTHGRERQFPHYRKPPCCVFPTPNIHMLISLKGVQSDTPTLLGDRSKRVEAWSHRRPRKTMFGLREK